jgi:hypothetical protein
VVDAEEASNWSALFDPKFKGKTGLNVDPLIAFGQAVMAMNELGLLEVANPGNPDAASIEEASKFLIAKKKEGQFRALWGDFGEFRGGQVGAVKSSPGDQLWGDGGEVVGGFALGGAVDGEGSAVGTGGVAEFAVIEGTGDAEGIGGEADEFACSGGAWGLESEEDADGFEEGGFALGVVAGEDGDALGERAVEGMVAAEVPESEGGERHERSAGRKLKIVN